MTGKRLLGAVLLLLASVVVMPIVLITGTAHAHQVNLTNARIAIQGDEVAVTIGIKGSDIDRAAGTAVYDHASGLVDASAVHDADAAIISYFSRKVSVGATIEAGGTACPLASTKAMPDRDGVAVMMDWDCTGIAGGEYAYRSTVLTDIEPSARQIVLVENGKENGEPAQFLLNAEQAEVTLSDKTSALGETVLRYVKSGIEHIFLGYDHVAFLLAILLWARRLMPVVKIVTAFTVAHSITLSLAASGIAVLPPALVEPAIAASIVYVAAENFISRNVDQRWRDTFVLGLIHGFGFAGALQAFGLPRGAVVPALASFNIGVEIGQLAIVCAAMPALLLLDRATARPGVVYAGSTAIMSLGFYWLAERTLFIL
jgi:hydrogenase/urease accessory protein HupE